VGGLFEGQASCVVVGCLLVGEGLLKCSEELLAGDMERLQVFGVGSASSLSVNFSFGGVRAGNAVMQ
jgi:hypothetical protein